VADALLEGEEADSLPDTAQGDKRGAVIGGGGVEEAVQANVEEVQPVQDGGLVGSVLMAALGLQVQGEVLGMAAEGGGRKAELPGQGAVGDAIDEAAVDLGAGRVVADGTAFYHKCAPKEEFPHDAGWEERLAG